MISVMQTIFETDLVDTVIKNSYDKAVEFDENDGGKQMSDEMSKVSTLSKQNMSKNQEQNRTMFNDGN